MDDEPGAGAAAVSARRATQVRPTVFGIVLAAVVVVGFAWGPPTSDPSVAGLVGAGMLGALVVGIVWPAVLVARLGLVVRRAPVGLVAGQLGSVEVELTGRASGLSLSCTGSGVTVLDAVSPHVVRLPLTVARRGVYRYVQIDIGTDAPFGVLRVRRTRTVELPAELLVGPVPIDWSVAPGELAGDHAPAPSAVGARRGDVVRAVRPYVVGDPSHLVHWPSSARTGQLVVRELDPPASTGLALVVDLGDPSGLGSEAVERAASLAAGAARRLLASGSRVVLCTVEATGPVTGEVADAADVRERLARAVHGAPPPALEGWPVLWVSPASVGAAP